MRRMVMMLAVLTIILSLAATALAEIPGQWVNGRGAQVMELPGQWAD